MSDSHIEGTFYLDGLLEGKIVAEDQASHIDRFVEQAAQEGLIFNLSIKGHYFSLLPDCQPMTLASSESAHALLERKLDGLLRHIATNDRMELMSTLRSVEYQSGQAIQTLYLIDSYGQISLEQRTVPAQTVAPARPLTRRQKIKLGGIILLACIVIISLSTLVVPYPQLLKKAISNIKPVDLDSVTVSATDFAPLFSIDSLGLNQDHTELIITCKTTEAYPKDANALNQAWRQSESSLSQTLVYESLARHILRCELFNDTGTLIMQKVCPIRWSSEQVDCFFIQVPFDRSVARINITF